MTPPTPEPIGARLVACPGFRWMSGMRTLPGSLETWPCIVRGTDDEANITARGAIPDLADPATAGCLLATLIALNPAAFVGIERGANARGPLNEHVTLFYRDGHIDLTQSGGCVGEAVAHTLLCLWGPS